MLHRLKTFCKISFKCGGYDVDMVGYCSALTTRNCNLWNEKYCDGKYHSLHKNTQLFIKATKPKNIINRSHFYDYHDLELTLSHTLFE